MKLSTNLKKEIETDIQICCEHKERNGSLRLYNNLVAKYIVIDPAFETGLSMSGKASVHGEEFDYRPELQAIASKLRMWLLTSCDSEENQNPRLKQIKELIAQGEAIGKEEFHPATESFPYAFVSGPNYEEWMAEINILNERYLKSHPSYESIHYNYEQRNRKPGAYRETMAQLKVISADKEYWGLTEEGNNEKMGDSIPHNNKVFIVHGHDDSAKQAVARFLEKMEFEAIILHEQADGGRTIIEKIEAYTDVIFAIVLYTPCDEGRVRTGGELKARVRQNVVFEHGYLIGKLGRNRVCALVKENIETLGDISGVIYKPMDAAGAWKTEILKEMQSAGIKVDAQKLLSI